jgi:hypothetical protein
MFMMVIVGVRGLTGKTSSVSLNRIKAFAFNI